MAWIRHGQHPEEQCGDGRVTRQGQQRTWSAIEPCPNTPSWCCPRINLTESVDLRADDAAGLRDLAHDHEQVRADQLVVDGLIDGALLERNRPDAVGQGTVFLGDGAQQWPGAVGHEAGGDGGTHGQQLAADRDHHDPGSRPYGHPHLTQSGEKTDGCGIHHGTVGKHLSPSAAIERPHRPQFRPVVAR
jgi:hypothetical protein